MQQLCLEEHFFSLFFFFSCVYTYGEWGRVKNEVASVVKRGIFCLAAPDFSLSSLQRCSRLWTIYRMQGVGLGGMGFMGRKEVPSRPE